MCTHTHTHTELNEILLACTILRFFPEGRLTEQAERGRAGNNGQMGRVGETTASSHQHRCRYRYRVILVFHRPAFGGSNDARAGLPTLQW